MSSEHDWEPVRGLPGRLPAGEHILWQGSPDTAALARAVFHVRAIGLYFVLLAVVAIASGSVGGAVATAVSGAICLGLLALFAWGVARTTIYTLTRSEEH
ncbi:MAG: PH domain-containing protein, partial [Alphaproteobacteria bacterium]|nr:PH domain-containing protein [Alphaproteobacteria bacterium]